MLARRRLVIRLWPGPSIILEQMSRLLSSETALADQGSIGTWRISVTDSTTRSRTQTWSAGPRVAGTIKFTGKLRHPQTLGPAALPWPQGVTVLQGTWHTSDSELRRASLSVSAAAAGLYWHARRRCAFGPAGRRRPGTWTYGEFRVNESSCWPTDLGSCGTVAAAAAGRCCRGRRNRWHTSDSETKVSCSVLLTVAARRCSPPVAGSPASGGPQLRPAARQGHPCQRRDDQSQRATGAVTACPAMGRRRPAHRP